MLASSEVRIGDVYDLYTIPGQEFCPEAVRTGSSPVLAERIGAIADDLMLHISENDISCVNTESLPERHMRVAFRAIQLDRVGSFNHELQRNELLFIAEAIEALLQGSPSGGVWKWKKRPQSRAVRSLVVDSRNMIVFVLHNQLINCGMCKRVKRDIALPFDLQYLGFQVAFKASRTMTNDVFIDCETTQKLSAMFLEELKITRGSHFFPDLYVAFQYSKCARDILGRVIVKKVCVIEELLTDGSKFLFSQSRDFAQLQFLVLLVNALLFLGERIHGDLKPSNVLFQRGSCGDIQVKLTDIGLSCLPGQGERNYAMERGFYGALAHTAPEIPGNIPSAVDWFKAEAWALGCCLFYWLEGKEVLWGRFFSSAYYQQSLPSPVEVEKVKEEIQSTMSKKRESLKKIPPTVISEITALCYDLLEVDPDRRASVSDIREKIRLFTALGGHPFQSVAVRSLVCS